MAVSERVDVRSCPLLARRLLVGLAGHGARRAGRLLAAVGPHEAQLELRLDALAEVHVVKHLRVDFTHGLRHF